MAQAHQLVTSFESGVLDPRMAGRIDVEQYYKAMSIGRNVVTVPLGGVKRRPGLKFLLELPPQLSRLTAGITITAPNGGTTTQANDNNAATVVLTTTNIGTTDNYVVVHYDFGAAVTPMFVDVVDVKLTAGSANFRAEYSTDNSNWSIFDPYGTGGNFSVDTVEQTFRLGVGGASARYWRLVRVGTDDLSTAKASIGEFNFWISSGSLSEVRLLPFERTSDDGFVIAATDQNLAIVSDGDVIAHVRGPWLSADLAELDAAQSQDTMILVHEDFAPRRLVRESATNWQLYTIDFVDVPKFDYDDALSTPAVADVQAIAFVNFIEGNTFQLELDGARSGTIKYQGTADADNISATEENIRRAVQKLYSVGFYGVSVDYDASSDIWVITFDEDSADNHPLIVGTVLSGASNASIEAEKITNGTARREPLWSATRGYPRTVTFHEGRLWFGGTRSLPQAYLGSVVNDFFNFQTGEGLDDDAVFGAMNTAQLNAVTAIKSGRFLMMLTTGGEFRFTTSPITPSDAPRIQTEYGAKQIKPVTIDGATMFVQRTGKVLRDFLYRYEEDAYSSFPLSALATHLLNDVVDLAGWQGSGTDDTNVVFLVNGDGTVAVFNTARDREIAAFSQWTTDGLFKAVSVVSTDRYFAVRRTIDGVAANYLEQALEDFYLDCAAQTTTFGGGGTLVGVLGEFTHLTGQEVRVRADGFVLENNTPAPNMVLEYAPTTLVEAGLDWTPLVRTMPLNQDFGGGGNFLKKKRVVKAKILVFESLGLRYNGRELPDSYWDQENFDDPPVPFTGAHVIEESSNWVEGLLTQDIDQVDPLPFHVQALDITVETS